MEERSTSAMLVCREHVARSGELMFHIADSEESRFFRQEHGADPS